MRKTIVIALAALLAVVIPAGSGGADVRLSFDHFYDHAALTEALRALEKAYPGLMSVRSIGRSVQGRDLWAVILNNPKTGPAENKPGYYIDGNIHGNEVQGAEVALYAVHYLLTNYGRTDFATRLLDERAFYVVPTMNPDARDRFLRGIASPNFPRSGFVPCDDDRDGAADEDGPEDLDGDGSITTMRKKDPLGSMKPHPDDPRVLVRARPGEKGSFIMLGTEGVDNDGDGLVNEDGPGGYDMNRNFGYNWQPNYVQRGAGDFPFSFPEARAVRDFILAHPNIAGAQSFHNYGGMILRGPGAKNLGEYDPSDRRVYDLIGKKGEAILPGYRYMIVHKDLYTVYGGTIDFLYAGLGIFTFSNELDTDLAREPAPSPPRRSSGEEVDEEAERVRSDDADLDQMAFLDMVLMGADFADWKPYRHPLYGDIEIGGVRKFGRRVPPLFKLAETCHRNAAFCLYHADQLARLSFARAEAKALGGGVYEISVRVANDRVTPSVSGLAARKRLHRADRLIVEGKGAALIAAGGIADRYRDLTEALKVSKNSFRVPAGVPGMGAVDLKLIVKGSGPVTLVYDSLKGGRVSTAVRLE